MTKELVLILIIVHVICDFYLQTKKTDLRRQTELKWVVYHSVIYGVSAGLLFLIFLPGLNVTFIIAFILSHGIIDILKYMCKFPSVFLQSERNVFLLDQAVHVITIIIMAYCMRELDIKYLYRTGIRVFFDSFDVSEIQLLSWTAKLLFIHKPANMLIAYILASYKPSDVTEQNTNDKNAGRFIGTLERIIMVIFISLEQYSAVGLVLTAKSIARYDRITKEQNFAEYYLLGTLLSTIVAVCVSIVFQQV